MKTLFDTTTINGMTLKNRFVRSATYECMATDDGFVTTELIDLVVDLAKGGVGMIIPGFTFVSKDGQSPPKQLAIYNDDFIPGLTKMVNAVHQAGSSIVIQLVHCGAMSTQQLTGTQPMGPSVLEGPDGPMCRAMTQKDIDNVVTAFRLAAGRARAAGFDGIQLHGAHGYLLSEFLSPFFNKRTDAYGGSVENRARIVVEAYHAVRKAVGTEYPVMIKINSEDLLDGGLTVDDMLETAVLLDELGIDAIELSGGTGYGWQTTGDMNRSFSKTVQTEVYWRNAAERLKAKVTAPLMLVGGIRSYEIANQLVNDGIADYISLCRPLMREPNLVNRWQSGDTRKAVCVSDNACFGPLLAGNGLQCVHVKK